MEDDDYDGYGAGDSNRRSAVPRPATLVPMATTHSLAEPTRALVLGQAQRGGASLATLRKQPQAEVLSVRASRG
jgi:hypothetical protein